MSIDDLGPTSVIRNCPTASCNSPVEFAVRHNGAMPVHATCPSCGTHLTLQSGQPLRSRPPG